MEPNPYLQALRNVAAGRTASFAELARLAGRPAAARAAGRAVAALPTTDPRPWHRIVQSDGGLARDPGRAAVQLERLRAEGARPRVDEEIRAWARRRRARFVGNWRSRALYELDDERVAGLDPSSVEVLRDDTQTVERGFYFAPPPPLARPPRVAADRAPQRREETARPRSAAQRRADLLAPETPEEEERIILGSHSRARRSSSAGHSPSAKSKRTADHGRDRDPALHKKRVPRSSGPVPRV